MKGDASSLKIVPRYGGHWRRETGAWVAIRTTRSKALRV